MSRQQHKPDYYALLGIDSKASKAEIKKNYRLLATKFHPDKNSDPDAELKFVAITEAYDTLSNRKARAQYDLLRWQALKKKNESANDYSIVVPPKVSTRERRNKAQLKRSIKFHEATSSIIRELLVLLECLIIVGRYTFHILGIAIFLVITRSVASQLPDTFNTNILQALMVSAFAALLVYAIFKIMQNFIKEYSKDIKAFSDSYKLPKQKVAFFSISIFVCILLLFTIVIFI